MASSVASSKKLSNVHSFNGKALYDGVFSGAQPKKQGSRLEDYGEIFGGSGSSSIPKLDVPELNDKKVSVDVRSSTFDYSNIFGGFADSEFAVPYDELFAKQKKSRKSSKEARAPAESMPCPEGVGPSNVSVENQVSAHEASFQSCDGVKQINESHQQTNQGSTNRMNGTTHIDQLCAVPGFTSLVNETAPLPVTEGGAPVCSASSDAYAKVNSSEGLMEGKPCGKASPGCAPVEVTKQASKTGIGFQNKSSRSRSNSGDMLFEAFDIGLRARHSRVPSPSSLSHNLSSQGTVTSKFVVSESHASEGDGGWSPPYLDEEVDANSVAAASAAAVRKAIEEAQAMLKFAKELMERRKEGPQNRVKLNFNDDLKIDKKEVKTAEKVTGSKAGESQETSGNMDTLNQVSARMGEHSAIKDGHINQNFGDTGTSFIANEAIGETLGKERQASKVDAWQEVAGDREAGKQFCEPANMGEHRGSILEFELPGNAKNMMQHINEHDWADTKLVEETFEKPGEFSKKINVFEVAHKHEIVQGKVSEMEVGCEGEECTNKSKSPQEVHNLGEEEKNLRNVHKLEDAEEKLEAFHCEEKCENKMKGLHKPGDNEEVKNQELQDNKAMKVFKEAREVLENGKKLEEACELEEMVSTSNEIRVGEEIGRRFNEIPGLKENRKEHGEHCEMVECKMKQNGIWEQVASKEQNETHRTEDTKEVDEVHEQEATEVRLSDFQDGEKCEKRLRGDGGTKGNEKRKEDDEDKEKLGETYWMNETEKRQETCELVDTERIESEIDQMGEDEIISMTEGACTQEENFEVVLGHEEDEKLMDATEVSFRSMETRVEFKVAEANDLEKEESFGIASLAQPGCETDGVAKQLDDAPKSFAFDKNGGNLGESDMNFEQNKIEQLATDSKKVCNPREHTEHMTYESRENDIDDKESQVAVDHEDDMSNSDSLQEELSGDYGMDVESSQQPSMFEREVKTMQLDEESETSQSSDEKEKNSESGTSENIDDKEENLESETSLSTDEKENLESETSQSTDEKEKNSVSGTSENIDDKEENLESETSLSTDEKENLESETSQSTDERENHYETLMMEEREAEGTSRKEVKLEKKRHIKIEEAKEREKERERERIAVERAIREARERAFAEARERAERSAAEKAAVEARRRVVVEDREKLEKASVESNGKSATEKASMEAKLKAERAAVERATAEARVRALEKALSDKARNKPEKFPGASSDNGIRQGFPSNDVPYKVSGPSSSLRNLNSSNKGVPCPTERYDGANSETAQRCKAKSERHQRTAERAAKALAEKNMRDVLAQREQAERDRLAEALDADVKRWSSGKERNLRALISTLHYILGPDSGWQPIPLTDLISTTSIKKAYRKATLFVHPDKLQQRGASIQQKYTCEKVFDILKEAWNRFNADER